MAPPIEYGLGTGPKIKFNPNPKTDPNPNPKSRNNICSPKRHRNKVQHSVINISYFRRAARGVIIGL